MTSNIINIQESIMQMVGSALPNVPFYSGIPYTKDPTYIYFSSIDLHIDDLVQSYQISLGIHTSYKGFKEVSHLANSIQEHTNFDNFITHYKGLGKAVSVVSNSSRLWQEESSFKGEVKISVSLQGE